MIFPTDPHHYKYLEHYHAVLRQQMPAPVMFLLYPIQGACSHHCYWCQVDDHLAATGGKIPVIKMETAKAISLLAEAKALGCRSFEVCGLDSEPMLHPDITGIFRAAGEHGFRCSLITNGAHIDAEFGRVVADYFDYIRISVDSLDEDVFNAIRQPRAGRGLPQVLAGIELLVQAVARSGRAMPCQIGLKACLSPENNKLSQVKHMVRQAYRLRVNSLSFKRAIHRTIIHPDYAELKAWLTQASTADAFHGMRLSFNFAEPEQLQQVCRITPHHVFVDANGDVPLCCYHWGKPEHVFGNVHLGSLRDIWYSQTHWDKLNATRLEECNQYQCKAIPINNFMHRATVGREADLEFFG